MPLQKSNIRSSPKSSPDEERSRGIPADRVGRVCPECGRSFDPPRRSSMFCSVACSSRANGRKGTAKSKAQAQRPPQRNKDYVLEWDSGRQKYRLQHRLVMERSLGRQLRRDEIVHHVNGIRDDNRLRNLLLIPGGTAAHAAHHKKHGGWGWPKGQPKPWAQKLLVPCPICGGLFKPKRRDRQDTKTCSYSCSNRLRPRGVAS